MRVRIVPDREAVKRSVAIAGALFALACGQAGKKSGPVIVVRAKPGSHLARAEPTWQRAAVLHATRRAPGEIALEIDREKASGTLHLEWPDACSADVDLSSVADGQTRVVELAPFLSIKGGNLAQLGFDEPFTLSVEPGCREALQGRLEWRQLSGPTLEVRTRQNGFVLEGRTLPFSSVHSEPSPWGIIPLSPRTRGQYRFAATFRGAGREVSIEVEIASAARATGLPSVAIGQRVYLGGRGWHVTTRPRAGGSAEVVDAHAIATLTPDTRGRWVLTDADGKTQSLVAGRHSETPLDCGRSDCHQKEADAAASSLMTTVFMRGLSGAFPNYAVNCALSCHTTGEPGLDDGGFSAVLAEFGGDGRFTRFEDLPRALRRLGGVGCTACHGPGAIPEPSARWAILRSDVCATCHDAPPTYTHNEAWRRTKMSKSDVESETREKPECKSCHTTAGFLAEQGLRALREDPPAAIGIACAACHAPHASHLDRGLVRNIELGAGFVSVPESAAKSRLCVACHAAPKTENMPRASAGTLVFGGTNPPHAAVAGGCIGCHTGHDFVARDETCKSCHVNPKPADASIAERAKTLAMKLQKPLDEAPYKPQPPHAKPRFLAEKDPERARALAGLLLVLEDPAAAVHNGAYARALLDEAERVLAK